MTFPAGTARSADSERETTRLALAALVAIAGAAGALAGLLEGDDPLSRLDWLAIGSVLTVAGVLIGSAVSEYRTGLLKGEVVVTLSSLGVEREVLERWEEDAHQRGSLDVRLVTGEESELVAVFPLRFGQILSATSGPSLELTASCARRGPTGFRGYDLHFFPDSSDWKPRMKVLYDKDDIEDALDDAEMANRKHGRGSLEPEVLVVTTGLSARASKFLAVCMHPEAALRITLMTSVLRETPRYFDLLSSVSVALTGLPAIEGAAAAPAVSEEFAIYARRGGPSARSVAILHYSARLWIGWGDEAPPGWDERWQATLNESTMSALPLAIRPGVEDEWRRAAKWVKPQLGNSGRYDHGAGP